MSGPSAPHPLPLLRLPSLRFTILLVGEILWLECRAVKDVNDANVSNGTDIDRLMPPVNLNHVIIKEILGKTKTTGP
jgi:hypothetical protein